MRTIQQFSEQDLSTTSWACAKLFVDDAPLMDSLAAAAIARRAQYAPQGIANTSWAFADLSVRNAPLLEALASAAMGQLSEFRIQELANTAWAYAALRYLDSPLLQALSAQSMRTISLFNEKDLTEIAWSFATLRCLDRPLLQSISASSIQTIDEFGAAGLSNLAWSFATLCLPDGPLLHAIASAAMPKMREFVPQGLGNTSWSFATLAVENLQLLDAIAAASLPLLSEFNVQNMSNTAWALAQLGYEDLPLMEAISAASLPRIRQFAEQNVSNIAWSFATLGIRDQPLMDALSSAALPMISHFTIQGLANIAWACAELGRVNAPLLDAISSSSIRTLGALPQGLEAPREGEGPKAVLSLAQALAASGALRDDTYASVVACLERHSEASDVGLGQSMEPLTSSAVGGREATLEDSSEPRVIRELPDVCVLWKPPGWTVTVSDELAQPDAPRGPASLGRPLQDWVAEALGSSRPVARDTRAQFGLVHRLDRDTSGALVCATTYRGYYLAQLQFTARRTRKIYVCLCHGSVPLTPGKIDAPLRFARRADNLWRSAVEPRGKPALTEILVVGHVDIEGEAMSLVRLRLHTGRQHQIRAHLASLGHPLAADGLYGGRAAAWCTRCFLHAERLSLDVGAGPVDAISPLPSDLRAALAAAGTREGRVRASFGDLLGEVRPP